MRCAVLRARPHDRLLAIYVRGSHMRKKKHYRSHDVHMENLRQKKLERGILRDGLRPNGERDLAFRRVILSIPPGKVSTYGRVAAAAGYPLYHRAVANLLHRDPVDSLPWHRVVGAGGAIKLRYSAAKEQRARLKLEGAKFRGKLVDMAESEHQFRMWELE
jgi:methylated-DNA-protein-cysteine methyltransferase related protein